MSCEDERAEVLRRLAGWGCDIRGAMERVSDDCDLYFELLDILHEDGMIEALGEALASDDVTASFEKAHALKGTLGNLGLTPMYEEICRIVEPLRAGRMTGLTRRYARLTDLYRELSTLLRTESGN